MPFRPSMTTMEKAPMKGGIINGNVRSTWKSLWPGNLYRVMMKAVGSPMREVKKVVMAPAFKAFHNPLRMDGTAQYLRKFSNPHPASPLNAPTKTRSMGPKMKIESSTMATMKLTAENQSIEPFRLNKLMRGLPDIL